MDNIVTAAFLNSHFTKTCPLWKYDKGMILHVEGVELPEWVEIHFSNTGDGTTTLGLMHNGEVEIPNVYFETGKDIVAYFYLHTGDSGYTTYQVIIPVKSRPKPNDGEPTVTQEEALDAAIEALNTSAQEAAESAESAEASAVRAEEAAASIDEEMIANAVADYLDEHPVTVEESDPTVPEWAKQPTKPSYTAQEVGAVPAETGKGLSTNDYTTAEKEKLAGIEAGAQKNPDLSHYVTDSDYDPDSKTSGMTQSVGVDANGKLWTAPGGSTITVDDALSSTSENPVQNKVVKAALDGKGTYSKPSSGIPASDLAAAVQTSLGKADTALQSVPSTYRTAAAQDTIDAGKADKITEVTISTSGAVTQALDAGKIYHFTGTLTALTISLNATTDLAQYHFDFNCGSTAPTVTIPSAVTMPDGQSFEANKHYEVDILNNYGAVISWAIS